MTEQGTWMLWVGSLATAGFVTLLMMSCGPIWGRLAQRRIADLTPRLQELNVSSSRLPRYLNLWGLAMLLAIVLGLILNMLPVALMAIYLIYVAPRLILNSFLRRRQALLRDQMVTACITLANTTRAGLSLGQGLASVAAESPQPLQYELQRIVHQFQGGLPLPEAIKEAKHRLKLDSFTLFANAVLVSLERGGRITEALENIGESLQENQRLERKIEADTASGRRVVITLAIFPFAYLGLFLLLDPENTGLLLSTFGGQLVLVAVAVLVYISVRWSNKILSIEV